MPPPIAFSFLVAAPVLYGLNGVLLKRGARQIPPFAAMSISMIVLLVLSILCAVQFERSHWETIRSDRGGVVMLVLAGAVNIAAFGCLLRAYSYVPVWQYQMFYLLTPIFSAIFAYLIIGEPLSARMFLGLMFVGAGLFIALR